jgi:protein-S-isoprenylcysteine O-methyltransferase Ste14
MTYGLTPRTFPPPAAFVAAPQRLRLVQLANAAVAALHLSALGLGDAAGTSQVLVAAGIYTLSAALLVWARRTVRDHPPAVVVSALAPAQLVVHGPFRFVRQPVSTACAGLWLAGSVATANPWLLLSTVWMTVVYVALAYREEERFDRGAFAETCRAYRLTTGLLVPRLQIEFGESAHPLSWDAGDTR